MSQEIHPKKAPSLGIPKKGNTVKLHIINTTCDLVCPAMFTVAPIIPGHETMNMPTFSFMIENEKLGKKVLFDAGSRKDWWNLAPPVRDLIKRVIPGVNIKKNVNEILEEGGVDLNTIDSIVWSHWHWDHIGDSSKFPDKVEVIVGPGVTEAFLPGYPERESSPLLATAVKCASPGHKVREMTFDPDNKIGEYPARDFFGDGSFYLLDVPGHAIGHMSALARTTTDTFVFLGGDICHFGGTFRPTQYVPMPGTIPPETKLDSRFSTPCPCSLFTACHPVQDAPRTTPYYRVANNEEAWFDDPPAAQKSIDRLQDFDADPNVFVCIAHDEGLRDVCTFFPHGTINDWKKEGMKQKDNWAFLNELPIDGKPGRSWLTQRGLMKEGEIVPSPWKPESRHAAAL